MNFYISVFLSQAIDYVGLLYYSFQKYIW